MNISRFDIQGVPAMPVYWEEARIPASWRQNKTYQRGHGYTPQIAGFDVETSQNERCAWMYLWCMSVDNLRVYGRTVQDFKNWIRRLAAALDLNPKYRLAVYVHNLKFDFHFIKNDILISSVKKDDFIAKTKRQIIKCLVDAHLEMRDSAVYTECPLWMMGEELGLPKLEEDYEAVRTPQTELRPESLQYCCRDCDILVYYYHREAHIYGGIGKIPRTATGIVKNMITAAFDKLPVAEKRQIYARQLKTTLPKNPTADDIKRVERDKMVLTRLRRAFFGGYCYASPLECDRLRRESDGCGVISADQNAAYAAAMLTRPFPADRFAPMPEDAIPRTRDQIEDFLKMRGRYKRRAMLLTVKIKNLTARIPDFGFLPSWCRYHVHENGMEEIKRAARIKHADEIEMTLTDVDLRLLLQWYTARPDAQHPDGGIYIISGLWTIYAALPSYIINTVCVLYARKKQAKKRYNDKKQAGTLTIRDEIEYRRIKSRLARIYGVFVQDPVRMQYVYDNDKHALSPAGRQPADKSQYGPVLYQWGVWVAAWARYALLVMAGRIGMQGGAWDHDMIYCDTDCVRWVDRGDGREMYIHMCNAEIKKKIDSILTPWKIAYIEQNYGIFLQSDDLDGCGQWEIERYAEYKQIGIKQYAYIDKKGHFRAVLAGLPQKDDRPGSDKPYYFDQWDDNAEKMAAFWSGLYIPAEYTNLRKTHYVDQQTDCEAIDEYGELVEIVSPCGCMLIPTDYRATPDRPSDGYALTDKHDMLNEIIKAGVDVLPADMIGWGED